MGRRSILILVPLSVVLLQCGGSPPTGVEPTASIEVFVHWREEGVPGRPVDLVETGESRVTGPSGIVTFAVEAGDYTVRVHGLTRGGPAAGPIDFPVRVTEGDTARVEAVDCLLCF